MAIDINIPSQVKNYANLAAFPATGTLKTIFIAEDTNKTYRWTGSAYVEISASASSSWGTITGTLSTQTDLQTALNAKQDTLVSGTNIKTINSTSLLGSGDIAISSGLTVGTTAITSGTDTRLLYQSAGVLSQSARMTFDGTKFIYNGTSATANTSIFEILGTGGQRGLWAFQDNSIKIGGNNNSFATKGTGTGQATNNFYSNDSHFCFGGVDSTKGWVHIGVNDSNPQAKLDIRAQGALSTDLAFRVRNSANSANIATIQGDGSAAFGTYTNPNTRLTVTGTTYGAYISGNTGIYAQSSTTSGTLYAIDCLGRALSGANTSFGIRAASDTSGVGSTNYGGRFNAYNGATNYAGYFDATGGTNNIAIYVQRGDIILGSSPTLNKIGFWNATPIVQPTTAVAASTFVVGVGTAVTDASTFDGYTIGQIVKALRNTGILA